MNVIDEGRKNMILVRWLDHYNGDHQWTDIDYVQENLDHFICETSGYLLADTKDQIKIAMTIADANRCASVFTIMKKLIVERIDFEL